MKSYKIILKEPNWIKSVITLTTFADGETFYIHNIKYKVNKKDKFTIIFPNNIEDVRENFIKGLLGNLIDDIGIENYKEHITIKAKSKELEEFINKTILGYFDKHDLKILMNEKDYCINCIHKEVCYKYNDILEGKKSYNEYFGEDCICGSFISKEDIFDVKTSREIIESLLKAGMSVEMSEDSKTHIFDEDGNELSLSEIYEKARNSI